MYSQLDIKNTESQKRKSLNLLKMVMHIAADETLVYHLNEEIEEDSKQRFENIICFYWHQQTFHKSQIKTG